MTGDDVMNTMTVKLTILKMLTIVEVMVAVLILQWLLRQR